MSKRSRSKGKLFEKKIAEELRSIGFAEARPDLRHENQTKGIDIVGVPGWAIQLLTAVQNCGAGRPNFAALGC